MASLAGWNTRQYQKQQSFLAELILQRRTYDGRIKNLMSEESRLDLMGLDKKISCVQALILDYENSLKPAAE